MPRSKKQPTPEQRTQFRKMGIALIVNEEARRLVSVWPVVDHDLPTAARRRQWAKLAAVRPHAPRIFEEGLMRAGLIGVGGFVDPEAEQIVTMLSLASLGKGGGKR
jgi:hypothetical protein